MKLFKSNWDKWEVAEENVPKTVITYHDWYGYPNERTLIHVDILRRKNLKTGEIQYKNVKR